jgi:Flp pilus assembly protein TadB
MAHTRKRRQTKHRGNAAGIVEARGRTGRRPAGSTSATKGRARVREDRWAKPPTWRSALNRSAVATLIFALLVILVFRYPVSQTVALAAVMLAFYVPLGYYTDLWIYRRRQRRRTTGA